MGLKNIITGWITSILGLAVTLITGLAFFGFIVLPVPTGISVTVQYAVGFIVGLALFLLPATKIEQLLEDIAKRKGESL